MGACEAYRDRISAYLDGELTGEERRELLAHLEICGDCRMYLDSELAIREALAGNGCKLTALAEYMEDGAGRALYLAPGYLEEFAAEMGLTMPENIAAALTAAGVHPVNWEELTHGG